MLVLGPINIDFQRKIARLGDFHLHTACSDMNGKSMETELILSCVHSWAAIDPKKEMAFVAARINETT